MAKCDLSIELDQPSDHVYEGGTTIRGKVRVLVDADVKCSGLVVESGWKTHGAGNVATGTIQSETLFVGNWVAGQAIEYPFTLRVGDWPPTYHGHYLNVDHYVDARINIPWGFDPKASMPFLMRPTCGPESATILDKEKSKNPVGAIFVTLFLVIWCSGFGMGMAQNPGALACFAIIPTVLLLAFLAKLLLPKYLLGKVEFALSPTTCKPGDFVTGELVLRPRKNVNVNSITMNFGAREECVSGSGSNQKTHKKAFSEQLVTLQPASTLPSRSELRFPISLQIPTDAPFTIAIPQNQLIWSAKLLIDIPRWPDWSKEIPIQVLPSGSPQGSVAPPIRSLRSLSERSATKSEDGITFSETAEHLWSMRDDRRKLETLVGAVTGLTFRIEAFVERRLLYAGEDDPHVFKDGYAVWAHYGEPPLPLVLYVPHALADEFEQVGRDRWIGEGTIVGWDHRHNRLQIKLIDSQPNGFL